MFPFSAVVVKKKKEKENTRTGGQVGQARRN